MKWDEEPKKPVTPRTGAAVHLLPAVAGLACLLAGAVLRRRCRK